MGMTTFIYGVIEEYGLNHNRKDEIYAHNESILSQLPTSDNWPPLSQNMFAITKGELLEYSGRIIHFGACLKSVEHEWIEWKEKFENLLKEMYWLQAHVHFKTEYTGVVSFEWRIDLHKWSIDDTPIAPIKEEYWEFEDCDKWESSNED